MVLLSVENTYDGTVREKNGVFLSAKHPGEGVGLQAVRHTVKKAAGMSGSFTGTEYSPQM